MGSIDSAPILGWNLDPGDRAALLMRFPPRYARTIADHVAHGREGKAPPRPDISAAAIIGHADDGTGVEALVVALDGASARWDGSTYHITWSLAEEREAKESNAAIARHGWEPVEDASPVRLTPTQWE